MKKLSVVMLAMLLFVGGVFAANSSKESKGSSKIGLGYAKTSISAAGVTNDIDSVACRFWFDKDLGIDVSLGFNAGDSNSTIFVDAKILGNFIKVNKLNIYWFGGIGFGNWDPKINGADSATIFRIKGGVGAEYYLLPCLSLLTEMGLRFSSISAGENVSDFGIYADWLPQAGVRFYFN